MNLQNRVEKLETVAEACKPSLFESFDMKALTNDELLAVRACYTDEGRLIPERLTPELIAALNRVMR